MDAWGRSLAFSTDDNGAEQLLDASGTQIMMEWERPYMARCVDEMRITAADRVLEVGFGCAYSAERIQRGKPKSHTIIECSEAVLQKLRPWAAARPGVIVVEGTWQQTLPALGTFDAIFMDDFGAPEMSAAEMEKCADPRYREAYAGARSHFHAFVDLALRFHSRPGTRISGYLVQPLPLERDDATVTMSRMPVAPPAHCHYFSERTAVVPLIVKTEAPAAADAPPPAAEPPKPLSRKERKKAKQRLERGGGTAEEARAVYGEGATASVELNTDKPIGREAMLPLSEAQNVVLWALTGDRGAMPQWMVVRGKPLLRGACVVLAPALDALALRSWASEEGGALSRFTPPALLNLPRAHESRLARAVAQELLLVRRPHKRKAPAADAASSAAPAEPPAASGAATAPLRRSWVHQFALSARELRENEYPPECAAEAAAEAAREAAAAGAAADDDDDDADEAAAAASGPAARLLGLDCEMCYAGDELQLARVAIVDETMTPLLDELVVPEAAVTDHNTAYSGITPAMLATATLTRAEVVAKVRALIDGDGDGGAAYLVGHSLENDLRALGMAHGRVLDTALLYPLRLNVLRPPAKASLRSLASRYLGRQIQTSAAGHDPTEDAAAAMELALLKLRRGLLFGVPGASYGDGFDSLHAVVGAAGWAAHAYDRQAELQLLHAAEEGEGGGAAPAVVCVPCASDAQAVRRAAKRLAAGGDGAQTFAWLALRALEEHDGGDEEPARAARAMRDNLERLLGALPPSTLVVLVGTGGERAARADGGAQPPGFVSVAVS